MKKEVRNGKILTQRKRKKSLENLVSENIERDEMKKEVRDGEILTQRKRKNFLEINRKTKDQKNLESKK